MANNERRDDSQPKSGRRVLEDRRKENRWGAQVRRTLADRRISIS